MTTELERRVEVLEEQIAELKLEKIEKDQRFRSLLRNVEYIESKINKTNNYDDIFDRECDN